MIWAESRPGVNSLIYRLLLMLPLWCFHFEMKKDRELIWEGLKRLRFLWCFHYSLWCFHFEVEAVQKSRAHLEVFQAAMRFRLVYGLVLPVQIPCFKDQGIPFSGACRKAPDAFPFHDYVEGL